MKPKAIYVGILLSIIFTYSSYAQQDDFSVLKGPYLGQKPPGLKPEVFAQGIISTGDYIEMGCTCTSDGKEIYFSRSETSDIQSNFAIWMALQEDGQWGKPELAPFSGVYRDFSPFVTPDGKYLLFYRMSLKRSRGSARYMDC